MRREIIEKTGAFIKTELARLADFGDNNMRMAEYRIEHSYRVANIAAQIASKEGFSEEKAFVAGLFHDIAYSVDMKTREEYRNHGRIGAKIARPFLLELGYSEEETNEMCFGIAIHVDDEADFEGERTPLALTIGDADNIDRFDAFRLYEGLENRDYKNMPLAEQREYVDSVLEKLAKLREVPFGTHTSTEMWHEKIDYQAGFYKRLKNQIESSTFQG